MCGIVGLLRWGGLAPEDPGRVARSAALLRHRGPDGEGFWSDGRCALGFRRLKVIDLTAAGDQPMGSEDGRVQVVFNGEIYNFQELRGELESRGHRFKSRADTEVLVHGYEEWGEDGLLTRVRGMFAFALWDAGRQRLLLARDPLGVKPLYFLESGGALGFASEPKAILALGLAAPRPDLVALHEALTYRYVPAPKSGFLDLEKLPPGNLAVAERGAVSYRAWWKAPEYSQASRVGDLQGELEDRLRSAVHRRLVSDVPLGVWLSGGVDSGLVLALLAGKTSEAPATFCAGFAQQEYDERGLAAQTAQFHGARHRSFEIPADLFRLVPRIVWHADEPFFDSSCLPTYLLAERTRPHVTVVLSGDGGDEGFAGYERYLGLQRLRQWERLPGWWRSAILALAGRSGAALARQSWARAVQWLERCRQEALAGFHPYLGAVTLFGQAEICDLFSAEAWGELGEVDSREVVSNTVRRAAKSRYPDLEPRANPCDVSLLQRTDLETYLPGDVLHKVDRMSMAHGVEVRGPFLDCDLLAWAGTIPDRLRLRGRRTKPLLRDLAARWLPREVARARKRGFGVPLDAWFRGPLKARAEAVWGESSLVSAGLFRPRYWERFWGEHQGGRANHGERLYALLAAESWHRTFFGPGAGLVCPPDW